MSTPSLQILFVISLTGGLGAVARYVLDTITTAILARGGVHDSFPWGMWLVNGTGSFAIGVLAGVAALQVVPSAAFEVVMVGFLGGYTTFSTASYDTVRLLREGRYLAGLVNGFGMLVLGVALCLLGLGLAQKLILV